MSDAATIAAFLDEHHTSLLENARNTAIDRVGPMGLPETDEQSRVQARDILTALASAGCYEAIARADWRACCIIREQLAAVSPLADAVFALQALGTTPLLLSKQQGLAADWASAALRGELMTAFAMTESEAGSDVGSIATTAERRGDSYVINGTKSFISNAGVADLYLVFATADPAKRKAGISCFAVHADSSGCTFAGPQVMSAPHPLGEVTFTDCHVPAAARIGPEGDGFSLGVATLERLRPTVGAAACGMAWRALRESIEHAKRREQFGKPLADFQLTKQKLARMSTELAAARLLVYRAAYDLDHGKEGAMASSMAKSYATEAAQRIVDDAVQILGGRGVLVDHVVDYLYRSVRSLRIYEGTTEIQQLIIAGHILAQDI